MQYMPSPRTVSDESARLRAAGLRVTPIRVATLAAIGDHSHICADDLIQEVRRRIGTASTQSVYDAVRVLTAADLVRRIEPAGHPARYECRVGDNHHHVVCRECGAIADVDCANRPAPCLTPVPTSGFIVDTAEVTFWGLCPQCAANRPDTSSIPSAAT